MAVADKIKSILDFLTGFEGQDTEDSIYKDMMKTDNILNMELKKKEQLQDIVHQNIMEILLLIEYYQAAQV